MRVKILLITFCLTLFANILCLPLWTEYDYSSFVRTLFNDEARLDVVYSGEFTAVEPFRLQCCPQPVDTLYWYGCGDEDNNTRRANLTLRARGEWQKVTLQLEALHDGTITLLMRGPDVGPDARNEYEEPFNVLTDWRNLKINGKQIFTESKTFSYVGDVDRSVPVEKQVPPKFNHDLMFDEPGNCAYEGDYAQSFSVKKNERLEIEVEFRRHRVSLRDFTWLKSGKIRYVVAGNLLFFFLLYRLLRLLEKRKRHLQPCNVIFTVVFFFLLFFPMTHITDAVRSVRENRMLYEKPAFKHFFERNSDYGKRYEDWLNDHFSGHDALIQLHDSIRNELSIILRGKGTIYFPQDDWYFDVNSLANKDYLQATQQSIVKNLVQLNKFCQENNIKLYVLEVPRKESVYKNIIKEKYGFNESPLVQFSQIHDDVLKKVRKHQIPYVYPYDALCDASKQDLVFFKRLHHWTDWGAYIGYSELMKEVQRDFPDIPVVSLNDCKKSRNCLIRDDWSRNYHPGYFKRAFNLNQPPVNGVAYIYYDHKDADKIELKVGKSTKDFTYPKGKYNIMLMGTSQNEDFLQFLPYSAFRTRYIRLNTGWTRGIDTYKIMKLYEKEILSFHPDILVISIGPGHMPYLSDIFSTQ